MPGRQYSSNTYRYGMNGQKKDDEVFQGVMTAEYWEYDARLGRRWNLDPISQVSISDYSCFRNSPILFSDPNGDYSKVGAWVRNLLDGGGGIYKVGKEWGYNTLSKDENGNVDGIEAHFGVSSKELANSVKEVKREALEEWIQEEKDIESFRKDGLWDDNITRAEGATNAVNLGLFLIVNSPLTKAGTVEKEGQLLLESQGNRLKRMAENPYLKKWLDKLWRSNAKLGDGSTGAMIKLENSTGVATSASGSHMQKGQEGLDAMKKLLNGNFGKLSETDRKVIFEVIENLTNGTGLTW